MQTLKKRSKKNTPKSISQAPGNCGLPLKEPRRGDGVADSKTFFNNPDATLTASEQAEKNLRVSSVFVLNKRGEPLTPCSPRKAKQLLKTGKASVVKRTPFVIQLKNAGGEVVPKQMILGVDSGYEHVGLSVVCKELKKEFFAAETLLRTDMVKLMSERKMYRVQRRRKHHRYRKPRFLNRTKPKGWLAPSIQHKLYSHIKLIRFIKSFLPITEVTIEVAPFDIAKIKNPEIFGIEYQQGEMLGFSNVREYVLFRDNHKCQYCKGKSKDKRLQVHHKISRQIAGNRTDVLMTLCETCHQKHHTGEIDLKVKISNGFKAEAFMNMVRWKIVENCKKEFTDLKVNITFGYITKFYRHKLIISKSHINDAFIIAGGTNEKRSKEFLIKQVRRSNRKLFKGARSHIKNTAPRFLYKFQRYDKVSYRGKECFILGRRQKENGGFDLKSFDGNKINHAKIKELKLLESFKTLLIN